MLSKSAQTKFIEFGSLQLESLLRAQGGDVLIRALHRGTPNTTTTPCLMVAIGYSRKWLRRPKVDIYISLRVEVKLKGCFVMKKWLAMTIIW